MTQDPTSIHFAGAVPLDSLGSSSAPAPSSGGAGVIDVTEASFEADVLTASQVAPVVIDFWADWCGPCKQLSPILEKLAGEAGGAWTLAKIDVDANPRLAQAAQVQGIPAVKAIVNGQVVSEFTGALPESQVRQWLQQLVAAARSGQFGPLAAGSAEEGEQLDPDLAAGDEALMSGDLDAAAASYQALADRLGVTPELRTEARSGLARVALLQRTEGLDPASVQQRLSGGLEDVEAVCQAADLMVLGQRADDAFALLLQVVKAGPGEPRDTARERLLALFEVVGDADPAVGKARRDLASALF